MQIGITQIIDTGPTPEFLSKAAAAGYEVVELAMRADGDLTPRTDAAGLKAIVKAADDAGIKLVSMAHMQCTGNMLGTDEQRRTSIDETIAGLEAAKAMSIGTTLHTVGRLSPDIYYDDAYRNGVASLKELAKTAEKLDVIVAVEFVWSGFLFSPMEMKQFLDDVGSAHVGFYFDPGNMAVYHTPHHWVKIVGPHVKMVHLKDWKGGPLNGGWPPLLEGSVDFAAMNRELRALGYDGPMISEVDEGTAPWEKTAAAIRKIIAM